jgi:DNA topoisomerase-1
VRLIVDREREIDEFLTEEYWRLAAVFTTDGAPADPLAQQWSALLAQHDEKGAGPTRDAQQDFLTQHRAFRAELASWRGERFKTDRTEVAVEVARALGLVVDKLQEQEDPAAKGPARRRVTVVGRLGGGPAFVVRNLQQRQTRSRPQAPLTTASMQQAAAVQLRFSADRTMRIAQQLYEGVEVPGEGSVGVITYMRTDGTHIAGEAVAAARALIGDQFGPQYLPEKPNVYASAQRAQEAHEAIRPTDVRRHPDTLIGALSDDQYKLYRLIWQRFVACQMAPAVWNVTEAEIVAETPAGQALFKAMGRHLAFDGFMAVTGLPRGGEGVLPELHDGQPVAPIEVSPTQHFTQPPPRYTEASLIKALEADGIGRPSTYATIIQTIQDRGYVEMFDRAFRPTELGKVVTRKLVKHLPDIFDVRFTAHMEDQLDKIEDASKDWVAVLEEFYGPFHKHLTTAAEEMVHIKAESSPSEYVCDACGRPMVYKLSRNGRYLACSGYPHCKQTYPVDAEGKKLERREVDVPCPECGRNMVLRRSRFGSFLGCSTYPQCKGTLRCDENGQPLKRVKPEEIHQTCPACGSAMSVKWKGRRAFLGCSRYPDCKTTAPLPEGITVERPPQPEPKPAGVNCPKCGRAMVIRHSRRGEFLACSGFPRCRNAMSLDRLEELKASQTDGPASTEEGRKPKSRRKSPADKARGR